MYSALRVSGTYSVHSCACAPMTFFRADSERPRGTGSNSYTSRTLVAPRMASGSLSSSDCAQSRYVQYSGAITTWWPSSAAQRPM